jgi:phenylalanyl-tRNA synthetase beta chain
MLKGADYLRRSLTPSLLDARRVNESLANPVIELFETARVYLPRGSELPDEQWTLGMVSGGDYCRLKGVVEAIVAALNPSARLKTEDTRQTLLDPVKSCRLQLNGELVGYLGEVSKDGLKQFGLRAPATIAELKLSVLAKIARLIPKYAELSPYPPIERDLNLIVDEPVRWSALAETVTNSAGDCLEGLSYRETYRDPQKDGPGKKRLLFSITLRSGQRTLTNEEADQIRQRVVDACQQTHRAVLLGG